MTVGWGLIGFGAFGRLHAQCLANLDGSGELRAILANSKASALAAEEAHPDALIFRNLGQFLAAPQIDAVDIVVPNSLHAALAIRALQAGKHVQLEKPMATSIGDCDALMQALAQSGRCLSVGHELRLSVQWARIKALIDEGAIGRPRYANLTLFRHPYRPGAAGWRHDPDRVGSWILEEPVHFYDLIAWYMAGLGEPVAVSAIGSNADPGTGARGMVDNFTSIMRYEDGAYATITQSLAGFGHYLTFEMTGSQGAIRSTWSGASARETEPLFELALLRAGADGPEIIVLDKPSGEIFELQEQLRQSTRAFAESRSLMPPAEARRAVILCLEAERALAEGREIALEF